MLPLLALLFACTPDPRESPAPQDSEPPGIEPVVPGLPDVKIEPMVPDGLDDLHAVVVVADGGGYTLRWWRDGEMYAGLGDTVPADLTRHGERWAVEATNARGRAWDEVTIGNLPPDPPGVVTMPATPMAAVDDLRCLVTASDADGDLARVALRWTVDGQPTAAPLRTTAITGDTVPAAALAAGSEWICTVEVDDGWGGHAAASSAPAVVAAFDPARLDPWVEPQVWIEPLDAPAGTEVTLHYRGALMDQHALTARLGFDGWSEVAWEDDPTPFSTPEGAPVFAWERAMEPQGDGSWALPLTLPEGIRAVHMVFTSDSETDDLDGLEYHWDPGFPYVGPFMTWSDAAGPADGVVVTFESAVPCRGVVLFSGPDGLVHVRTGEVFDTLHHIVLDGLDPDITYTGVVADSTGRFSDAFSFTTLAEDEDRLSLLVMADMQDGGLPEDTWPAVALAALATVPDARAAVLVGDLTANDNPGHWWRFFAGGAPLFARVPLIPLIGNHDTPGIASSPDDRSFRRWFDRPTAYYAVDLGPARLIALSSEILAELESGSAQHTWLRATLATTRLEDRPWVFAGSHHPPYDIGARFASETERYREVTELCDGVVDWFFAGHEHIYQRTLPLRYPGEAAPSGAYGLGPLDGVGYLVAPTAGDVTFDRVILTEGPGAEAWAQVAFPTAPGSEDYPEEQGFIEIELDGPAFALLSWGVGTPEAPLAPWVRDSVSYTKP